MWRKKERQPDQPAADYGPWQTAFTADALRRAWVSVKANKGRSGSDGETWHQFERHLELNLRQLRSELLAGEYQPQRVTQVLVPKPSGGWRPITLWAIRDRVAQRAVYNYLEPVFEPRFLDCSYGFRPGRSTHDAAQAVQMARQAGAQWVLDADIKDCFGSMQDRLVLKRLQRWRVPQPIVTLMQRWLRAEVWNAWGSGARQAGTSQGGVISPLLCNLYLHPFDQALHKSGIWLVRYADDFVCLSRDEKRIRQALKLADQTLQQLSLQIHPQKTRLTTFDEGFQFVGWFFIRNELFQLK